MLRGDAAQLADVGVHQHGRAVLDAQQLKAPAYGKGKLARQIRRDQAYTAGDYHQRDGALEQCLGWSSSLRSNGDPIPARSGKTQNSRRPAGDHFVESAW